MIDNLFSEALTVFGTNKFRVQCYFLIKKKKEMYSVFTLGNEWRVFDVSDEEPAPIIFVAERDVDSLCMSGSVASTVLEWASRQEDIHLAVLMFDGVFSGGEHLISVDNIDKVFGAWSPACGPILTLDRKTMMSPEWQSLIRRTIGIEAR